MPNPSEDKEQGRFEGMVVQRFDGIEEKLEAIREEQISFRYDAYDRINLNTQDIARQKGWMAAIALVGGTLGGFIKSFIYRQ